MKNVFRVFFSSRALVLGLALAVLTTTAQASTPTPKPVKGPATVVVVRVTNQSNTCAWVTIYWATFYTPWSIAGDAHNRPRFVHKGGFYDFAITVANPMPVPIPAEIKVRTEVTRNADCSGGTLVNHEAVNKGILADPGTAGMKATVFSVLSGSNPYHLSEPRH
jgi:hypothetical protein